jgi:hypothetical protein
MGNFPAHELGDEQLGIPLQNPTVIWLPPNAITNLLTKGLFTTYMLFDDAYNVVDVIDWEFAHSAPLEVFAALTNMYSRFDSKTIHAVPDSNAEGRQYIRVAAQPV